METVTTESVKVLAHEGKTNLKNLMAYIGHKPYELMAEAERQGLQITGAPIWEYQGADGNPDTEFTLCMCLPIAGQGSSNGGFKVMELPPIKCVRHTHHGPWTDLPKAYESWIPQVIQAGFGMGQSCREVYLNADMENPANCITEIQMEVL